MKTEKNILIAFLLNLGFSVFEFFGGFFTGSVAILSDALHDLGDAISIGISWYFERLSKKQPDKKYTYGYLRYSVLGGLVTTTVLIVGSIMVTVNAVSRIFDPVSINYNGMIIFAVIGAAVNFFAAFFTKEGDSLNQKAVNLHMIEDVLGWLVVLTGAIIMRFTDIKIIDPLMSLGVAIFILINSIKNLKEITGVFLEKTPESLNIDKIKEHLLEIDGVKDVHHIHLWSIDGESNYITMHIVCNSDFAKTKAEVKEELAHLGINHSTLEMENEKEACQEKECVIKEHHCEHHHHHHHHH